jgi:hypothetical protein
LTGREAGGIKPVFGLTAAILIRVATIGYARVPTFEVQLPNAPTMEERIAHSLLTHPTFRQAYIDEGMNPELAVGSVLKPIQEGQARKESEKLAKSREQRRRWWRDGSRL